MTQSGDVIDHVRSRGSIGVRFAADANDAGSLALRDVAVRDRARTIAINDDPRHWVLRVRLENRARVRFIAHCGRERWIPSWDPSSLAGRGEELERLALRKRNRYGALEADVQVAGHGRGFPLSSVMWWLSVARSSSP